MFHLEPACYKIYLHARLINNISGDFDAIMNYFMPVSDWFNASICHFEEAAATEAAEGVETSFNAFSVPSAPPREIIL